MSITRLMGVLALFVGLGWVVGRATAVAVPAPLPVACSASALTASLTHIASPGGVSAFGCDGPWAYLWATVALGPNRIGVTELMRFDAERATWIAVSRTTHCHPGDLPTAIYRRACFSN